MVSHLNILIPDLLARLDELGIQVLCLHSMKAIHMHTCDRCAVEQQRKDRSTVAMVQFERGPGEILTAPHYVICSKWIMLPSSGGKMRVHSARVILVSLCVRYVRRTSLKMFLEGSLMLDHTPVGWNFQGAGLCRGSTEKA